MDNTYGIYLPRLFKRMLGDKKMGVKTSTIPEIVELDDGFGLFADGNLVGAYSRRRDAVRGARRRGLTVA